MKAIELMIGDLVRKLERGGHSIPVKIIAIYEHNADYETRDGHTGCMSIHGYEPIPLTEEIVGDRSCPQVSIYWDDRKTEETGENWYEVMIHTNSCAAELHIRYVHELQHALRLCGIEKEIIL